MNRRHPVIDKDCPDYIIGGSCGNCGLVVGSGITAVPHPPARGVERDDEKESLKKFY